MAGNQLTLAYLQVGFSEEEREQLDQALKQRTGTLRPNIDSLDTRRRVRRTPSEIQERETQVPESLSAYRQAARGQQPYCRSRSPSSIPRPYHLPNPNCPCDCRTAHIVPNPKDWQSSLAEEPDWDYNHPNGGHAVRTSKVTFTDPVVTKVREFERWYADSYGILSRGGITDDQSTEADDDKEIQMLDAINSKCARTISEQSASCLESTKAFSDRKDFKRWCGDAFGLTPSTKEADAEVDDGDEIRGMNAAKHVKAKTDERPKIKSLRNVSISSRRA